MECLVATAVGYLQFFGQQIRHDNGEAGEQGRQKHADVANVNGNVKPM